MNKAKYEEKLANLQRRLVNLQSWVIQEGMRVVIVFEGRDAAGKGGCIKAITERVSPRVFRTVALPAPTNREKTQLYMQRYMNHLPAAGEVVLFDRSWYNRAGVERVMGFCTEQEADEFLEVVPDWERLVITSGIILIKYWLGVSNKEQEKRFLSRIRNPLKQWKLSPMDLASRRRWYDYSMARDKMLAATDTEQSPWYLVHSDDKRAARLNLITHMLDTIPHEEIEGPSVYLPGRDLQNQYDDQDSLVDRNWIPENH
jgi:polyphosphate kinase 2